MQDRKSNFDFLASHWKGYLLDAQSQTIEDFAKHERTGRPLGSDSFIEMAESLLNRNLKRKNQGQRW